MYENQDNNMNTAFSDGYETTVSGVDNVTRKGKGRKAALIGGISAAVIAGGSVTAYAVSDTVKNQVKLRVSSPEKYYAWVTEKNSDTIGRTVGDSYRKLLEKREKGETLDIKLSFEPSQDAKDMLSDGIFGDVEDEVTKSVTDVINNTNEIFLSGSYKVKKNRISSDIGLELDGKDIATYEFAADVSDMDYFFRIPELKEQWLCVEMGDSQGMYGISGIISTYKALLEDPSAVISPDELEEEVNRYAGVWADFADEVKLEKKESVDICDISVNYTVATVNLTDKDADKLGMQYLEEMKNDKLLRDIVVNRLKLVDEAGYMEDIEDGISGFRNNLEKNDYDNEVIVSIDTYIDATGTIRGLWFRNDDEGLRMLLGKDGSAVRGELAFIDDNEPRFRALLKAEESGKSYSGDLTFISKNYYNYNFSEGCYENFDEETVTVNFSDVEVKDDEKGYFSGDFSIIAPDADPIDISFISDGKSEEIKYDIIIDGTDYGRLKLVYALNDGVDIDMPSKSGAFMVDMTNIEDYEGYISSDELAEFLKNTLEKIGIDKELAESGAESFKYGYDKRAEEADGFDYDEWDSDDFDFDYDDEDEDEFGSTAGSSKKEDIIGGADAPSGMVIGGSDDNGLDFEFDPSQFRYEDFKDQMTEEEFNQWMDLMEQFTKKAS
ncbi:MAG: hypothetical protein IKW96_07355 [Ruminococcus sp.]|uniref:hypothetical protein n=1 Tax=Ruminococcus sp. TaxID=41978 RepID=UPI0025EAD558|nr:hypothetical protein [Ruminococcus sp.]MBR5683081.1 hypothetical protein [Ruminococcus sp.]